MPKILINEKDKTSPGTPNSYSNFSVLITGFMKRTPVLTAAATEENPADAIQPDSNGVYEFSSAQAFYDTIGLVAPKVTVRSTTGRGDNSFYHYGNQMAYELLNMGYSIIYKPIILEDGETIEKITEESFWEDFKDKSSYDFRFITHGLLESSGMEDADKAAYNEAKLRLEEVEKAIAELNRIDKEIESRSDLSTPTQKDTAKNELYIKADEKNNNDPNYKKFEGFKNMSVDVEGDEELEIDGSGDYYINYSAACDGTASEKENLEAKITYLVNGGIVTATINKANTAIANLAKYVTDANGEPTAKNPGRGDCIALIEVDETCYTDTSKAKKPEVLIIDEINKMTNIDADNGKYCAMTVPSVYYKMSIDKEKPNEFGNNVKFPGAFHYLACFINSLKLGFAEWYAAAGYTRGIASYMIDYTSVKLGEIAINALEPRNYSDPESDYPSFACNVIANFRGSYYLWGNRTCHPLGKKGNLTNGDLVASSFLNIRHLCTTIKKQLYVACRSFTFDPNSDTLWVNFCNAIRPTLEAMKADQGIRDFKIQKVYTDKKATLKAKIRIIPIEAVEDFDLEVSLEDSFGETAAVVSE